MQLSARDPNPDPVSHPQFFNLKPQISNGMTLVQDLRQDTFRTKLRIFLGINICKYYP